MNDYPKNGTRIFKKSTPNGKITIYLGKRDFYDHLSYVDPIEGVVLVDPDYVKHRKVFVQLLGAFRYGRDEVDLLGMAYYSDLYLATKQVYPPNSTNSGVLYTRGMERRQFSATLLEPPTLTRLQERLLKKLGAHAHPFYFQLPAYSAASVSINTNSSDHSKPCRVDYELKVYVAEDQYDKPQKRNSVRMVIRKLTYAPMEPGPQPSVEVTKDFLMSLGNLRVEVSLDKHQYHHGETVCVNVLVDNNSNKTVKKIKITMRQYATIALHTTAAYKCTVAEIQSEEGFPITASQTGWCKVYRLYPSLTKNRQKFGIAMDGDLKHEDTNLASSTVQPPASLSTEPVGINVQYKVKVRLTLGFGVSDVCVQLPFLLTHSPPKERDTDQVQGETQRVISTTQPSVHTSCNNTLPSATVESPNLHTQPQIPSNGSLGNVTPKSPIPQSNPPVDYTQLVHYMDHWDYHPVNHNTVHSAFSLAEPISFISINDENSFSGTSRNHNEVLFGPRTIIRPIEPLLGSFRSDRRFSVTRTQSTASDDDLFDDFARLRLQLSPKTSQCMRQQYITSS